MKKTKIIIFLFTVSYFLPAQNLTNFEKPETSIGIKNPQTYIENILEADDIFFYTTNPITPMNEKLTVEKAEQELADLKNKLDKGRRLWGIILGSILIIIALILLTYLKPSPKLLIGGVVMIIIGLLIAFNILKVELDFRIDETARKMYERINYLEGFIDAHQKKEIKD